MIDTLIVETENGYKIERYKEQNLDTYPHVAEVNHEELCTMKVNEKMIGYWYMRNITLNDIFDYLQKEFNYQF